LAFGEQNCYGIPASWVTLDWEGADIIIDLTKHESFPFPDNSQDLIYSSHMIEHLDMSTLMHFLNESHRILKRNGGIRLEAPDFEKAIEAYKNKDHNFLNYFMQSNQDILVENMGLADIYAQEHIAFIGIISCYINKEHHIPVIADKEIIDEKLAQLNSNDFGEWCVSLQTPEQQRTGGHVNPVTGKKLIDLLKKTGFEKAQISTNKKTSLPNLNLKRNLERTHRAFYSFYVEAQK